MKPVIANGKLSEGGMRTARSLAIVPQKAAVLAHFQYYESKLLFNDKWKALF
jgi:hypothetical protein